MAYLENPEGKLEHAQQMAAHSDPKTTRLYALLASMKYARIVLTGRGLIKPALQILY
jgi:hypothetical protein